MKVYTVGGAVRDMLMGFTPKDIDYVVVGSSVEEMLSVNFSQVGADFPVFLHPVTGDEYALARREKKTGEGYLGFTSEFGADVTLEEDLGRRDLTINSISMETEEDNPGHFLVFDPFGGMADIQNKVLRHTSNAFEEDPVRVLRLARFRARFGPDWKVAPETAELIFKISKKGVLSELKPDRVWKELSRALMEPHPRLFFDTLLECDALHKIFPTVYKLKTALEAYRYHGEGNSLEHTLLVLTAAAKHGYDLETRFAALTHDFGKGLTRFEDLPSHFGHDMKGMEVIETFCETVAVPTALKSSAKMVARQHMKMHNLDKLRASTFVKMFMEMDAFNKPERVELLVRVAKCDHQGRLGSENENTDYLNVFSDMFAAAKSVKFADLFPNGENDVNKIQNGFMRARTAAVAKVSGR